MSKARTRPGHDHALPRGVEIVFAGRLATITLQAAPLNIFDFDLIRELHAALLRAEKGGVGVVVFRSALPGAFSAGVDVKIHTPELAPRMLRRFHELIRVIADADIVFVAEVDGVCLGGGFELALVCDLIVASPRSSFAFPEIDLGCFPPVAAAVLPRTAPAASSLILTGQRIDATEALRLGLIHEVTVDVSASTTRLAATLLGKSGRALAMARRAVRLGDRGDFGSALQRIEHLYRKKVISSKDAAEGVKAFVEKRQPRWRHS